MDTIRQARFGIGQVFISELFDFRAVVFDVDPEFNDREEWLEAIPESLRPSKNQPFYHLLASKDDDYYVAYAPEGNLIPDDTGSPVNHPETSLLFERFENGRYFPKRLMKH